MDGPTRRKLAAIVFTDICGYSALSHRDEKLALALLDEHRKLVRPLVAQFNGTEIKTIGDAFFLEFTSAVEAVNCAIAIQETLRERNRKSSHARRILLRIGIHLGDVVVSEDASDLHGDGVNIAARLQFLAAQGGICISGSVYEHVHARVAYPIVRMGGQHLKNISRPIKIYRIDVLGSASSTFASLSIRNGRLRIPLGDWRVALSASAILGFLLSPLFLQSRSVTLAPGVQMLEARQRIAVLPLAFAKGDEDLDYIAEGIADELTTGLSRNARLRVLARGTLARFKTADKSPREIGDEFSVGTILSGTIRKVGKNVRLSVNLSDTTTDENLWSETYETSAHETPALYEIQKKIVARVGAQFTSREPASLTPAEESVRPREAAPPSAAYLSYLKGRFFMNRRTEEALRKAVEQFESSLQINSRFAPALSGLAEAYGLMGFYGYISPREAYSKSATRAAAAYALDPTSAEVITHRAAQRLYYDHDWDGAEEDFRTAIETYPGYATAHQWYAEMLTAKGEFKQARESFQRAAELDPLSLIVTTTNSFPDYYNRQPLRALRHIRTALEMDSRFSTANLFLGRTQLEAGDRTGAIESLKKAVEISSGSTLTQAALATAYAVAGRTTEARSLLAGLQRSAETHYVSPYELAIVQAWLGDREAALDSVEKAYRDRAHGLIWMKVDPRMDPLRKDPRFNRIQSLVLGSLAR